MHFDPRSILLFGCNALLLYLVLLVNSSLAAWSLHLFILGPMIVIPALYLRHAPFFLCTMLSGLWVDAALPASFGLFTLSFLTMGTMIFLVRVRFRAEQNYHPVLLAHACNFALLVLVTLIEGHAYFAQTAFWWQLIITALLSHLLLFVIAPWFYNLERLMFKICHLETEPEDLPIT
jgi:hypothetical protein